MWHDEMVGDNDACVRDSSIAWRAHHRAHALCARTHKSITRRALHTPHGPFTFATHTRTQRAVFLLTFSRTAYARARKTPSFACRTCARDATWRWHTARRAVLLVALRCMV